MIGKIRLKIAVLIKRFISTGGAERYALEVTRRLALHHDVHVFAQEWDFSQQENIIFHRIPRVVRKPTWLNHLLFSHLASKAIGEGFDIVHSHEKVAQFDVMTIHSPCFRSFLTQEKLRWKRHLIWLSVGLSPRQLAWLSIEKRQFAFHPKRLFLAVSEKVKSDVQSNYPLPNSSFCVAYPGVDARMKESLRAGEGRDKKRLNLGLAPDDFVVLFVGTEFKRKGLDGLLRAFSLIPDSRCKLVVAGEGGGKIRKYKEMVNHLRLNKRVLFLGLSEKVGELYALADAVVLPTLSDPFAMAPIEAMLCGVPVALSSADYCGAAECMRDNEALIINNPTEPHEIAKAIHQLREPAIRAELIIKGQVLAKELTWERATEATLSAYHEVLRRKDEA